MFFLMRDGGILLMEGQNAAEFVFISFGHRIIAGGNRRAVFARHRRKSRECVEPDDFAVVIERFVDASEVGKKGEVLSPSHAEFHDHAVDRNNALVEILHEVDPRQGLTCEKHAQVVEQFGIGDARCAKLFGQAQLVADFLACGSHQGVDGVFSHAWIPQKGCGVSARPWPNRLPCRCPEPGFPEGSLSRCSDPSMFSRSKRAQF